MARPNAIPAVAPVPLIFVASPEYVETLTLTVAVSTGVVDVDDEMKVDKDG